MTAIQLDQILGDTIEGIHALNTKTSSEQYKLTLAKAEAITNLSRQAIKNHDSIIQADRLASAKKISAGATVVVLGKRDG